MDGFELNKIAGAVLLSGLVMMVVGNVAEALYAPAKHAEAEEKRGFKIEVAAAEGDAGASAGAAPAASNALPDVLDMAAIMAKADAAAGQAVAKKCAACHSFDKGGANKVGPNLYDIVGNNMAHSAGFAYSKGLAGKGGKWGYEELYRFLAKPKDYIPGTKMAFAGISKSEERANLIAYLRTLSDSPKPLP